jgi:hypothetical protein
MKKDIVDEAEDMFASIMEKLSRKPVLMDEDEDIWMFYCPFCKEWYTGKRHGYSSEFSTGLYFECPKGHKIEAPR